MVGFEVGDKAASASAAFRASVTSGLTALGKLGLHDSGPAAQPLSQLQPMPQEDTTSTPCLMDARSKPEPVHCPGFKADGTCTHTQAALEIDSFRKQPFNKPLQESL